MKVSVVIPVFDEAQTVGTVIRNVCAELRALGSVQDDFELLVVDDGSRDETRAVLEDAAGEPAVRLFVHDRNQGKGAAVARGIAESRGAVVVIQDADLEYDPRDLGALLAPIFEGRADVVFGSRFTDKTALSGSLRQALSNRALTRLSNLLSGLELTDVEAGYKAFRGELIRALDLESPRFGFEPEVAAKVARLPGVRVTEVSVSYASRGYEQGKKITWRDGIAALWWITKFNLRARVRRQRQR